MGHNYLDYRNNIQSGDLLVWDKGTKTTISHLTLEAVRLFTRSEYAHTAIAWHVAGRLFIIEATMPEIRIMPLSGKEDFYHIPMHINWQRDYENWLLDKVGLEYSISDGVRAYLGNTTEDDNTWQCAELCNKFYRFIGINLGNSYTPAKLVRKVLEEMLTTITYVNSIKQ